jgi:ATP-dependent DNA helicase RecG
LSDVEITEYPVKPVSAKGRYYKRTGNSNHLMSAAEVANLHLKTVNSSWDFYTRPGKTIADLSLEKIQKGIDIISRRNPNNKIASIDEFLHKHELVKGDTITNACYLMFCKEENQYTTIQMGHFASETVIKDDVSTSKDILSEVDEVMLFVIKHINKGIIISGQPENIEH